MSNDPAQRQIGDLTIKIDRGVCSALEACIREAPGTFCMGADDIVSFTETPDGTSKEVIIEACRACPVAALSAVDKNGKTLA